MKGESHICLFMSVMGTGKVILGHVPPFVVSGLEYLQRSQPIKNGVIEMKYRPFKEAEELVCLP